MHTTTTTLIVEDPESWAAACQIAYSTARSRVQIAANDPKLEVDPTPVELVGAHTFQTVAETDFEGDIFRHTVYLTQSYGLTEEDKQDPVDLDEVVRLVQARGVYATVVNTGGGCMVLYAGASRPHESEPTDVRYAAACGPGWLDDEGHFRGHLRDLYVMPDVDPDDVLLDGTSVWDLGGRTPEHIADLVVAQAENPGRELNADELEGLGFDGTGRGFDVDTRRHRTELGNRARIAADYLSGVLTYWHDNDLPGDFSTPEDGFPFDQSLDEIVAGMYGWASTLRGEG